MPLLRFEWTSNRLRKRQRMHSIAFYLVRNDTVKGSEELSFNIKVFIKNNLLSCLKIYFYLSYKAAL